MAAPFNLSVNPNGFWSPRQAKAVLETINPEVLAYGIRFQMIDVATHDNPYRVLLVAVCIYHDRIMEPDSACVDCMRESGN